ncbi:hypothetical protein JMJ77_0010875 [Colletotrichum scovillei]|uniref:Uncharacterized protein n=1 Tax=Colletotrichum scovillei TaxID=1209932 RepID=A0A9P7R118_9PEZI|nr:hypothetical protein JMJ77_0010875 [Colletotrichum scovillei]KAG7059871.1 hypothetical protein JMJ78_0015157 [Colletotrichum scovillei]KAG7067291.1 hypothetical protein JMJ76_0008731 [Colletotrichum scovillei]
MQRPPAVRPSRPSRHPTEFLTASLLPPPSDSRAPSPTSSNPGPTCAGRPCRFGPGVSETTPVQCHARAMIGRVTLERNTSTAVRVRQSRLKAQATQGGYVPRQIVAEVLNLPTTSCSGGLPIDENRLFSSLLDRMRHVFGHSVVIRCGSDNMHQKKTPGGLSPILSHSCGMPFNASTFTPPLGTLSPVTLGWSRVPIRSAGIPSQLIDDSSDHPLQGFSCPAVPASGPLAPVGYRPGLLRSLPHQVAPRYSQSQSQRKRTRQRRRTYTTTVPATLGASPPRGDYSFSPPVPPEPPLPGSERGSGG